MVNMACMKSGYKIEFSAGCVTNRYTLDGLYIQNPGNDRNNYRDDFFGRPHDTFVGMDDVGGPLIISQLAVEDGWKTIVRTRKGEVRLILQGSNNTARRIAAIKEQLPEFKDAKIKLAKSDDIQQKLFELEKRFVKRFYKFGVLNTKKGQTDENEIFGNNERSPDFEEFLDFLGQRILLKGWKKYAGELDTGGNVAHTTRTVQAHFRRNAIDRNSLSLH